MHTRIVIQGKGDPPCFPELADKQHAELLPDRVAILEGGMQSGMTSLMLSVDLPDGSIGYIQFSSRIWMAITGALQGACQRWGVPVE